MDEIAQRRDLFRSLALGVIELDGSGRIQFASQVACDLLGYPAEELHGAPAHEALHATTLDGAPLSHAACPLCGALARGGEARGWEGLFRQANGAPMRVIASATGSLDDHGRPCGGLIAFQAPADQPGIDERLQERAAELAEAQRIARLGSWSWDIQTDRTYWTAQVYEILGVDCAEWQNTYEAFLALVHPEDRDSVARAMESSLEEGGYAELDFRIIRPDSAVRWVRERYYCDRAEDGTPLWVRGTVQDITEYVEVTQKLEEAVRTKTEFLHAVNHDLRNSLYALSGLVGRLGRTTTGESQSHWIGLADGAIRHMLGLVDTLTDIAQLEQGHLKLRRQWTPLHSFLDEHRSLFAEQAAEKGLSFHWKVDPTLAEAVWLDPTRVSQVLNNLVGNAIKFTDEGWVQVEFRSINDEYLGVSVEDTGPGVRNEDQARIFEPFERAPPGECRLQGTGFGLTICQRLIRMMDGDLTLYSTPGQGSRFVATIRVPLTAEGGARPRSHPGWTRCSSTRPAMLMGLRCSWPMMSPSMPCWFRVFWSVGAHG